MKYILCDYKVNNENNYTIYIKLSGEWYGNPYLNEVTFKDNEINAESFRESINNYLNDYKIVMSSGGNPKIIFKIIIQFSDNSALNIYCEKNSMIFHIRSYTPDKKNNNEYMAEKLYITLNKVFPLNKNLVNLNNFFIGELFNALKKLRMFN